MQTQLLDTIPPGSIAAPHSVLVVDDHPTNRMIARVILEAAGHRVVLAESGAAALKILEQERPSLVLLDYQMPEMDGVEVAREIRKRADLADLPITMLTASGCEEAIEAAFEAGANDYITKPVDRRVLTARVKSTLQAADDRRRAHKGKELRVQHDALVRELEDAARIQRSQLPAVPATFGQWWMTGGVVPCGRIGGDAFDLLPGRGGSRIAVLVDVSGHGTGSALMAASVTTQLRALVRTHSLEDALAELNDHLCAGDSGMYACVAAVEMHGDHVVVVNAGLPPVSVARGGEIKLTVEASGPPPGLIPGARYDATELQLERGDRIFMVSDGMTEPFGSCDEVEAVLKILGLLGRGATLPARPDLAVSALFGGRDLPDDATLVIIERGPSPKVG